MAKDSKEMQATKNLMGALVRMKPKPHDEMKVGDKNRRSETKGRPAKTGVSSKPKTA
jgi:hypothetical protein